MRILFVFPNIGDGGYKLVGVSTLSALAKKAGHETALFDTSFMDISSISAVRHLPIFSLGDMNDEENFNDPDFG